MRYLAPKAALKEKIFTHLFEEAEIAKFNAEDRREYEDSLKPTATSRTPLTRPWSRVEKRDARKVARKVKWRPNAPWRLNSLHWESLSIR